LDIGIANCSNKEQAKAFNLVQEYLRFKSEEYRTIGFLKP